MTDEHTILALVDFLTGPAALALLVALLLRGDLVPQKTLSAIVAQTVSEVLHQLEQNNGKEA